MGLCCSCHSTSEAKSKSMLILPDGTLQEFSHSIKVSEALLQNPDTFICNSDEMEFDNIVSPIKADDELQPGQLYFALPLKRLNHPLQPEEMAALAVKAAAALAKCGCRRRHRRKNIFFTSSCSGEKRSSSKVADAATVGLSHRSCGGGGGAGGGGKRQNFKAMLSAIPE